ncbi:MAG: DEAD/DEAH box helicase [Pelomonas sp.]|nr:DEAD/DEAH box helicase [Roseateles sp.]
MVDFSKLRTQKKRVAPKEPLEIFRRLPKPPGINDLYTSQAEVLENWFERRNDRDVVVKLHTGGGKTLVGLLMAQSAINELQEPVLYLAPNRQLVNQTLEKAKALGISAVPYAPGEPLDDDFVNGKAIMVATYKALFNGRTKFGLRGGPGAPVKVGAVVLDDAHVSFSVVRDSFTLEVPARGEGKDKERDRERYEELTGLFRRAFKEMDRLGTFDDTVSGLNWGVVEVPYWAWHEQLDAVREVLKADAEKRYGLIWPLVRDNLHLCHALISRNTFTITPVLPLVNMFPTFEDAPRRIYMSATIADDSEIVRTFDADPKFVDKALTSRSLAGISERMILIPDLMPFKQKVRTTVEKLLEWTSKTRKFGAVVLVSSNAAAEKWSDVATHAEDAAQVEALVEQLQTRESNGPMVFANRYDGIDLPGDACRLLVMEGLPSGTSDYELLRAATLYGGATINRMLAQRIEQGIGRGARGAGDHCVVMLVGSELAGWVAKDANFRLLTSATRAQLEMGTTVSQEVKAAKELGATISKSFNRDADWVEYHAETLAEGVEAEPADPGRFELAAAERKAFNLWANGNHANAIARLDKALANDKNVDGQTHGWVLQLAARISSQWGQSERSDQLQRDAFARNPNLHRPKVLPPYRPLDEPTPQAKAIAQQLEGYRIRRGLLHRFEDVVAHLHAGASANQFEQALADLAQLLGLSSERFDNNGEGPDLLWLLPGNVGFVIEAKSRKKGKNALTKEQHGQLLVAQEWFEANYPDYEVVRVSVHPNNVATKAASAGESYALTYEKLAALISDARVLLTELCESQLADKDLVSECAKSLKRSQVRSGALVENYLQHFVEE